MSKITEIVNNHFEVRPTSDGTARFKIGIWINGIEVNEPSFCREEIIDKINKLNRMLAYELSQVKEEK